MAPLPVIEITPAQIVAHNIRRWRVAAGQTQGQLAERLGWTAQAVSAAERTVGGQRVWKFGADQLTGLAAALGVPLLALFLPPWDEGSRSRYVLPPGDGSPARSMADLMALVMPDSDDDTPQMAAYRLALTESVERLLDPGWSKEVARWFTDMGGPEVLAQRRGRLGAVIAELTELFDAMGKEAPGE